MVDYIFSLNSVGKIVPPKTHILQDINLSFYYGAKIGILGLNGSGKSTLLRIIAGVDKEYEGEVKARRTIKIGYLAQEPELDYSLDVRGNIEQAVSEVKAHLRRFDEISMAFADPDLTPELMDALLAEQGELQTKLEQLGGWELDRKLELAAESLRLPPWDAPVLNLSGGEKRRVALCKLLLTTPDLLLLDEPTNHLDAESVAWLERYLQDFQGTVIAITHDRYFLDNVAGWILELDRGRGLPFEGNYSKWLETKDQRLQQEQRQEDSRLRTVKSELEWVQKNPKGRRVKNKARIARFEELCSKEFQKRNETSELYIPPGPRLGSKVIEVLNLTKSVSVNTEPAEARVLFENLNFSVPNGAIVGIIGANGAGKSTLFKLLTQQEQPDSGEVVLGETVKLAYVDQSRDALNGDNTVWQEVSGGLDIMVVGGYQMPSRAYVGRFNFKGGDQQKLVRDLSGGERNRVHLAKLLSSGGNVLLLDEPTNDLDVETLRALEEALLVFPGSVLVISHDRWFLDRIATHILAFEDDGSTTFFEGNFSEYEEAKLAKTGVSTINPRRIQQRILTMQQGIRN